MTKSIYLAGGCFWGIEKYLSLIPGVLLQRLDMLMVKLRIQLTNKYAEIIQVMLRLLKQYMILKNLP